jgi:Flp pilus assembly protein TadG
MKLSPVLQPPCSRIAVPPFVRRLLIGEEGAGTTIAYLMVVPLYIATMMLILESCFMLLARVGVGYAAFAAARSAIVSGEQGDAKATVRQTAVAAFTPFASSLRTAAGNAVAGGQAYVTAFEQEAGRRGAHTGNTGYVARQYADAVAHVTVAVRRLPRGEPWEEDVEVTVGYAYPFVIPLVGRLLGAASAGGVFQIRGTAVLGMEHPENPERKLGIAYGTP